MVIILFVFGIFFAIGLFLILAEVLRIPTIRTVQAMESSKKHRNDTDGWRSAFVKAFTHEPTQKGKAYCCFTRGRNGYHPRSIYLLRNRKIRGTFDRRYPMPCDISAGIHYGADNGVNDLF